MHVTPSVLVHRHVETLLNNLERAFDGDVESVHQARVATRRLREILPLAGRGAGDALPVIRSAGRHLGRVRDLDVMCSLLDSVGSRIPGTAAAEWHRAGHALRNRRHQAQRKMVKALEQLDLESLRAVAKTNGFWQKVSTPLSQRTEWAARIWQNVVDRSREAAEQAHRTRAVYLPNRAHRARVAIKKLRYALEVTGDTGLWEVRAALKDLRRAQDALGDVHDLQILGDTVGELTAAEQQPPGSPELPPLRALLAGDRARRYADYIKRRERIFLIADACTRAAHSHGTWRLPAPLVAVSVITAPIFIEAIRSLRRTPEPKPKLLVNA